ncbi:MAG: hypothetical protein KOO69_03110 [Victivallales bacterium]|nr:hypothetical protein [Victivallales bacterium]
MDYDKQRKLGLRLFKGEKYKELRKAIKDEKCLSELLPIAEKAEAIEYWDSFIDEWKFWVSHDWPISNEMLIEAFPKLKEEKWIYWAGCFWSGISNEMLIEAFLKLKEEEWICRAGYSWSMTGEMLIEAFLKLKEGKWKYRAGCNCLIPDEIRIEAFGEFDEGEWRYLAFHDWLIPEEREEE